VSPYCWEVGCTWYGSRHISPHFIEKKYHFDANHVYKEVPTVTTFKAGDILKLTSKVEPTSVLYLTLDFAILESSSWYEGNLAGTYASFRVSEWDAELYIPPLLYKLGQIVRTHTNGDFPRTFVATESAYRRLAGQASEGGWFAKTEVQEYAKYSGYEILFEGI
jgi:hypothetical protein